MSNKVTTCTSKELHSSDITLSEGVKIINGDKMPGSACIYLTATMV